MVGKVADIVEVDTAAGSIEADGVVDRAVGSMEADSMVVVEVADTVVGSIVVVEVVDNIVEKSRSCLRLIPDNTVERGTEVDTVVQRTYFRT